jgi:hypothetical protein
MRYFLFIIGGFILANVLWALPVMIFGGAPWYCWIILGLIVIGGSILATYTMNKEVK